MKKKSKKNTIKKINIFTITSLIIFVLMIMAPFISNAFATSGELDMSDIDNLVDTLPEIEEGSVEGVPVWDINDKNQAIDCYLFAYQKYLEATNFEITAQGVLNTPYGVITNKAWRSTDSEGDVEEKSLIYGIQQAIRSVTLIYNRFKGGESEYFSDSHGKIIDENTLYQTGNYSKSTMQKRLDEFGLGPEDPRYIINKNSVKKVNFFNKTKNGYSFKFVLDNDIATVKTKKFYLEVMKDFKPTTPVFSKVEVECIVGFDGNLVKVSYIDAFKAKAFGVDTPVSAFYAEIFKFNVDVPNIVFPY